ncbi:MAG: hypothetical protein ACE5ER_00935 [Nitrospinaceae bacterium]
MDHSLSRPTIRILGRSALGILVAVVIGYYGILHAPFNFDDGLVILHNPHVQNLDTFGQPDQIQYRHLFFLSMALNYFFGGEDPFGYHLFNLVLHLATSLLVLLIVFGTIDRGAGWGRPAAIRIAGLTGLMFALHPIQTEAVTYISGRSSGMMAFFYLLSLGCFFLASLRETRRAGTLIFYTLCVASGFLALLSKETAATLPVALFLYDLCFMRREGFKPFRQRLLWVYLPLPCLIAGLVYFSPGIKFFVQQWFERINPGYALAQVQVTAFAAKMVLFPINQTFDYEFPFAVFNTEPWRVANTVLMGFLFLGVWGWLFIRFPLGAFGLGWYLLVLFPTNSILPRMDLLSERNLYLPAFGLLIFLAAALDRIIHAQDFSERLRRRLGSLAAAAIILCLFGLLGHRNTVYENNITLWEDALEKAPGKARIYHNLSNFYTEAKDYGRAFVMLKKLAASKALPYYKAYAHSNLGNLHVLWGDMAQAEREFTESVAWDPDLPSGHFNLGVLYAQRQQYAKAHAAFQLARQAQARFTRAMILPPLVDLYEARVLFHLNRFEEAEREARSFLRHQPRNREVTLLLASILRETGREKDAQALEETALQLDPTPATPAPPLAGL